MPPEVRGAGNVPLVRGATQFRVVHPVVLAVHDVVAQLHVFEDLAQPEQGHAQQPGGREPAEQQQGAAAPAAEAHRCTNAANIAGITLAQVIQGALAQGVQFCAEGIEFGWGKFAVASHLEP
ncbi:hypothetical protein D3C85_1546410 [compost metagenome]